MARRNPVHRIAALQGEGGERLFRVVAEASSGVALLATSKHGIVFVSSPTLLLLSRRERHCTGKPLGTLLRRRDGRPFSSTIFKPAASFTRTVREFSLIRKDGSGIPCTGTFHRLPHHGSDGTVLLVLGHPSGDRESRAEDVLPDNIAPGILLDAIPDGVCVVDGAGAILDVNPALARMLGRERAELRGCHPPYPWHGKSESAAIVELIREALRKGPVLNRHFKARLEGGAPLVFSYSLSLMPGTHRPAGHRYLCCIRDVTGEHVVHHSGMIQKRIDRLRKQVRRNAVRLQTLQQINSDVLRNSALPLVFRKVMAGLGGLVDHDLAGIYILDEKEHLLRPHTLSKQTPFSRKLAKFPLRPGEGIIGSAAIAGTTVMANDAQHDPRSVYPPGLKPPIEHIVAAPLQGSGGVYGILVVSRNRHPRFHDEDVLVLRSFADAVNVALENAGLRKRAGSRKLPGRVTEKVAGGDPR